jgi:hypothetical protein
MERGDYSFLFDPPKDSDVFTRTLYYPRSPDALDPFPQRSSTKQPPIQAALGDNRHAETLSKFTAGVFSSSSAALETVAPFLSEHIPDQVHIPDGRGNTENSSSKPNYCYRHQPDLRCQRRAPQEGTVFEIQKVWIACGRADCRRWTDCL